MTFKNLLTKSVIISRLSAVSGNKRSWATITAENCHIMQLDPEKSVNVGGSIGKTFILYTDVGADISDGDKLQDQSSDEIYVVKAGGVVSKTLGSIDHLEVLVERIDD